MKTESEKKKIIKLQYQSYYTDDLQRCARSLHSCTRLSRAVRANTDARTTTTVVYTPTTVEYRRQRRTIAHWRDWHCAAAMSTTSGDWRPVVFTRRMSCWGGGAFTTTLVLLPPVGGRGVRCRTCRVLYIYIYIYTPKTRRVRVRVTCVRTCAYTRELAARADRIERASVVYWRRSRRSTATIMPPPVPSRRHRRSEDVFSRH